MNRPTMQTDLHANSCAAFHVPPGAITLWWLGQSGYLIKSPQGRLLAIDPYLSNSCKAIGDDYGFDMDRLVPPPLPPADLVDVDLYAMTHSHGDHLDPETVAGYRAAGGRGPTWPRPETGTSCSKWAFRPTGSS